LTTRDTVIDDTPARFATSSSVGDRWRPRRGLRFGLSDTVFFFVAATAPFGYSSVLLPCTSNCRDNLRQLVIRNDLNLLI
jgi:hypothetical protein